MDKLKTYRTTNGLSQKALAERLGVDQSIVSKLEGGVIQRPSLDLAARIESVTSGFITREELRPDVIGWATRAAE